MEARARALIENCFITREKERKRTRRFLHDQFGSHISGSCMKSYFSQASEEALPFKEVKDCDLKDRV